MITISKPPLDSINKYSFHFCSLNLYKSGIMDKQDELRLIGLAILLNLNEDFLVTGIAVYEKTD